MSHANPGGSDVWFRRRPGNVAEYTSRARGHDAVSELLPPPDGHRRLRALRAGDRRSTGRAPARTRRSDRRARGGATAADRGDPARSSHGAGAAVRAAAAVAWTCRRFPRCRRGTVCPPGGWPRTHRLRRPWPHSSPNCRRQRPQGTRTVVADPLSKRLPLTLPSDHRRHSTATAAAGGGIRHRTRRPTAPPATHGPGAAADRRSLARRRRGGLLPGAGLECRGHQNARADHRRRHAGDDGRRRAAAPVVAPGDRRGDRRARRDPARPRRLGRACERSVRCRRHGPGRLRGRRRPRDRRRLPRLVRHLATARPRPGCDAGAAHRARPPGRRSAAARDERRDHGRPSRHRAGRPCARASGALVRRPFRAGHRARAHRADGDRRRRARRRSGHDPVPRPRVDDRATRRSRARDRDRSGLHGRAAPTR